MATKTKSKKTKSKSKKTASKRSTTGNLADQPSMQKLMQRCRQGHGATIEQLAKTLGGVQPHTVRSMISRLEDVGGVKFGRERDGRIVTFSLPAA